MQPHAYYFVIEFPSVGVFGHFNVVGGNFGGAFGLA